MSSHHGADDGPLQGKEPRVFGVQCQMRSITTLSLATLSALLVCTFVAVTPQPALAFPSPHVPASYLPDTTVTVSTDTCATCHRVHTAQDPTLLPTGTKTITTGGNPATMTVNSQAALCFTCHNGTGATSDVQTEYTSATPNNPNTASYYQHDATTVSSGHTLSSNNEFGGVLNRHSLCSDCHNPHSIASNTNAAVPVDGLAWPISGRQLDVSFVTVSNPLVATDPVTLTFDSGQSNSASAEYQICFKCHSSFTTPTPNDAFRPSQDSLDAAAEFNPANAAFHPIEAAGKNTTAALAASLNTASSTTDAITGKLWTFTTAQTVRCTNCHADGLFALATKGSANGNLPNHTSAYRGILIRNYQDRVLNAAGDAYQASNYSLCFACHTDTTFADNSATNAAGDAATNFIEAGTGSGAGTNLHRFHMTAIANNVDGNTSTSIDHAGDGGGNALCAECHFRSHSSRFPVSGQASNSRLVNFGPNVTGPDGTGTPTWDVSGTTVSCSLTCHGKVHDSSMTYTWVAN